MTISVFIAAWGVLSIIILTINTASKILPRYGLLFWFRELLVYVTSCHCLYSISTHQISFWCFSRLKPRQLIKCFFSRQLWKLLVPCFMTGTFLASFTLSYLSGLTFKRWNQIVHMYNLCTILYFYHYLKVKLTVMWMLIILKKETSQKKPLIVFSSKSTGGIFHARFFGGGVVCQLFVLMKWKRFKEARKKIQSFIIPKEVWVVVNSAWNFTFII